VTVYHLVDTESEKYCTVYASSTSTSKSCIGGSDSSIRKDAQKFALLNRSPRRNDLMGQG
jgi:hypothetical protein